MESRWNDRGHAWRLVVSLAEEGTASRSHRENVELDLLALLERAAEEDTRSEWGKEGLPGFEGFRTAWVRGVERKVLLTQSGTKAWLELWPSYGATKREEIAEGDPFELDYSPGGTPKRLAPLKITVSRPTSDSLRVVVESRRREASGEFHIQLLPPPFEKGPE